MSDTGDYIQLFVDETSEQLDDLVEVLLVLEREPTSVDDLNEAFRLIHSIKGAAGMMGLDNITVLTHHLESRFESLRSGLAQLDESTMNLVLRCIDFLRDCIQRLRQGQRLGSSDELLEELAELSETAAETLRTDGEVGVVGAGEGSSTEATAAIDVTEELARYRLTVHFDPDLPLVDLKASLIVSRLSQMGEIVSTQPPAEALEDVESVLRLDVVLTTEEPPDSIRAAADVDGVRSIELAGGSVDPAAEVIDEIGDQSKPEVARTRERQAAPASADDPEPEAADPELPTTEPTPQITEPQEAGVGSQGRGPDARTIRTSAAAQAGDRPRSKGGETMRVGIDRLDDLLNLAGELVVNRARFVQVAGRFGTAFSKGNAVGRTRDFGESLSRTIEHLQSLSNTNGELTREIEELEAGMAVIARQSELWEQGRKGFAQINEAIDQLTRISDSLQRGVLQTRMVPVGPLFNRFNRVVRDLSGASGKQVELIIRGEKTELDKRMIDELGDPLVHLVRNAIDHGIESPETRITRGKPETGTIFLEATHSGNSVLVSIRDDGGGINVARIKDRLLEREILAEAAIADLSDEQALEYVWHPGFSTAREVTDISGRGVGMDAVRARISELNGTIDVGSVPEQGTTFTIRLPLTLAIINSLLITVQDVIFAIPIDDVREIVKVSAADSVTVSGRQTIDVRGEFMPLTHVTDLFDWQDLTPGDPTLRSENGAEDADHVDAVVLQVGERIMALQVDDLLGSQEIVIKSLSENFVPIRGLSGASVLGDGTVCLMLDVGSAMELALTRKKQERDS